MNIIASVFFFLTSVDLTRNPRGRGSSGEDCSLRARCPACDASWARHARQGQTKLEPGTARPPVRGGLQLARAGHEPPARRAGTSHPPHLSHTRPPTTIMSTPQPHAGPSTLPPIIQSSSGSPPPVPTPPPRVHAHSPASLRLALQTISGRPFKPRTSLGPNGEVVEGWAGEEGGGEENVVISHPPSSVARQLSSLRCRGTSELTIGFLLGVAARARCSRGASSPTRVPVSRRATGP